MISKNQEKSEKQDVISEKQVTISKKSGKPEKPMLVTRREDMKFYEENPFIMWDENKSYSCGCPRGPKIPPFWPRSTATNHSKIHGYNIHGQLLEKETRVDPQKEQLSVPNAKEINAKIEKELERLEQSNPQDVIFSKVEEGIQNNLAFSIANDLKDLAKNTKIMYVFQKLKSENKIPKNITLSAFIADLFGYYCNKFGHNFAYYQDTSVMGPVEIEIQRGILYENMEQ